MDLFIVNRYDEAADSNDPAKEKRILEKLQKKIDEKNKRKKIKLDNEVSEMKMPKPVDEQTKPPIFEEIEKSSDDDEPEIQDQVVPVQQNQFTILGDDKFERRKKINMVLPPWLAYPTLLPNDLSIRKPVKDLIYLNKLMKTNLKKMNVEHLFPVQSEVIPWILNAQTRPTPFWPRDICVSAPTGSGKTLAFAVPIVQLLQNVPDRKVRALIVLPVQELANQVFKVIREMCTNSRVSCALLSTAAKLSVEQKTIVGEIDGVYHSKVNIIVTTAGRLVEHIHATKGFSLKSLKFLVIDEADRVMQEIQNDWLYHINKHVQEESAVLTGRAIPLNVNELFNKSGNQPPHKLLFSATLSPDPEKLKALNLFQPKLFTTAPFDLINLQRKQETNETKSGDFVGQYTIPAELTQKYCLTELKYRPLTLYTLIKENSWRKFLCFTNSKLASHRLSFILQKLFGTEIVIEELSSNLNAKTRQSVLDRFANGTVNGLVCSDALARGIDIPNVEVVISYEPAYKLPTYIHRIGRTARAGRTGTAITILTSDETNKFMELVDTVCPNIQEMKYLNEHIEQVSEKYKDALHVLNAALQDEKQSLYRKQGKLNQKKPTLSTNAAGLNIFEKLQSNLPDTNSVVKSSKAKRKQFKNKFESTSNLPQSWKANEFSVGAEAENDRKKKNKLKRKEKLKQKYEKLIAPAT